jgi:glycosyltransferase involved in cell wall biosynthesis
MTQTPMAAWGRKTGDTSSMRILLAAPGVESARRWTWGHLLLSLEQLGHEVIPFDPDLHRHVGKPNTIDYVRKWFVESVRPDAVCLASLPDDEAALISTLAAAQRIPVTRLEADALCSRVNTRLFTESTPNYQFDIVVCADASPDNAPRVRHLAASFNIAVFGENWNQFPDLDAVTFGSRPYSEQADLRRMGRLNVLLPPANRESTPLPVQAAELSAMRLPFLRLMDNEDAISQVTAALDGGVTDTPVNFISWALFFLTEFGDASEKLQVRREGPAISCFTAAYNIPEFIGQSIESVLGQTTDDIELLVLNDGSSDNTRAVIERYAGNSQIRIFDQQNIGQTGRFDLIWRTLLPHARGDFIANLDGDDISMPNHFARMLETFKDDPDVGLVHSAAFEIDEHNHINGTLFNLENGYSEASQLRDLMFRSYIAHPTILCRREMFDKTGTFEDGFAPDYHFWLKTAKFFRFRYLPERLIKYRVHSMSSDRDAWEDQGARTRREERNRWSIRDLYPGLMSSNNARDYQAAHVDLGLKFVRGLYDGDQALAEWQAAIEIGDGDCREAVWNSIVILMTTGRKGEAQPLIDQLQAASPGYIEAHMNGNEARFAEGTDMTPVPFSVPADRRDNLTWWDGSPVKTTKLLVIPDPANLATLDQAIETVMQRSIKSNDIQVSVATNGLDEQTLRKHLMSKWNSTEEINVERIDDSSLIPQSWYYDVIDLTASGIKKTTAP